MNHTSNHYIGYAIKYQGNAKAIYQAIANHEPIIPQAAQAITILDQQYPSALRNLEVPPVVLFYHGHLELLQKPAVAIIGSRQPNSYGSKMTEQLSATLSQHKVIVSGLAKGIDAIAHHQACKLGQTIGILGCGINRCYPKENQELYNHMRQHQLLLSEYPAFVAPHAHHFLARNRIIAALSDTIFVMAASYRSGTMSTVNEALALSKEISCLPYPIDESSGQGCNLLISAGANMLTNVSDLGII